MVDYGFWAMNAGGRPLSSQLQTAPPWPSSHHRSQIEELKLMKEKIDKLYFWKHFGQTNKY